VREIKHDGFRIIALRNEDHVRLFTRNGYDFAVRIPKVVAAVESLPVRSFMIDGEAIAVNEDGLSDFDLLRYRRHEDAAVLCAFDIIELDGKDRRWATSENRKGLLADLLSGTGDGIAFNAHFDCDGETIFKHVCALGCEGIVSKRVGSSYRPGRVEHWLKVKNPDSPAVREHWRRCRRSRPKRSRDRPTTTPAISGPWRCGKRKADA
jgi:bifunctional non-homologous end joining protein LigD